MFLPCSKHSFIADTNILFSRSLSGMEQLESMMSSGVGGGRSNAFSQGELIDEELKWRKGEGMDETCIIGDTLTMRTHRHSTPCTVLV